MGGQDYFLEYMPNDFLECFLCTQIPCISDVCVSISDVCVSMTEYTMLLPQLFISYFIISKQYHITMAILSVIALLTLVTIALYAPVCMIATADCSYLHCCPVAVYMNVHSCSCIPVSCTFHIDHCGEAVHFLAHSASAVALGCGGEP